MNPKSEIPPFQEYFPSEERMPLKQRNFYHYLEREINKHNFIDVQGQINYLFVYVYKILNQRRSIGYSNVYDELMEIAEAYHNEKDFFKLCKFWSADCLLASNEFDLYLEQTEPETPIGCEKLVSNTRLNIQKYLGLSANGIDLFKMVSGRVTKPTKKHEGLFKDLLIEATEKYEETHENWFDLALNDLEDKDQERYALFSSSILLYYHPNLTIYLFDRSMNLQEKIISLAKRTENFLRENLGLPKIGEGWVSEIELYYFLKNRFSQTSVIQHGKSKWLGKQHFDIWFPRWRIAVEYHGRQHFEPVRFFGGSVAFEETKKRDIRKKRVASARGVKFFIVTEDHNHEDVAKMIIEYLDTTFIESEEDNVKK